MLNQQLPSALHSDGPDMVSVVHRIERGFADCHCWCYARDNYLVAQPQALRPHSAKHQ